jgi:Na+-driven multidrug efflux pump
MNTSSERVPKYYQAIAWLALVWNLIGLVAVVAQVAISDAALAELPANQQELIRQTPSWFVACALAAVIFGVAGSLGLVLRKKWAIPAFLLSLVGLIGQQSWMWFFSNTFEVMGPGSWILPTLVMLIAIGLLVFSFAKKDWLG